MNEEIKATISSTEALDQLSPQCIVEYLSIEYKDKHKELLDAFYDDELIERLGGIDQILENHGEAVQAHVANINASNKEHLE